MPPPRTGVSAIRGRNVKRVSRRRRVAGATEKENPCRANPMSATCLKMAGRRGEEEAAERVGNPVSGTVVGGVGPAGRTARATGWTWTLSSSSAVGAGNPKRGASGRETGGGDVGTYRVGGPNPTRGSPQESRLGAWTRNETPDGLGAASAKVVPGARNPMSSLLLRPAILCRGR